MGKPIFLQACVVVALLLCSGTLPANGLLEGKRISQRVLYSVGWIEVDCSQNCQLTANFSRRRYEFDESQLGFEVVPDHMRLFYIDEDHFTVETEVICDTYAENLPVYYCLADVVIEDGKILSVDRHKRTESDDFSVSREGKGSQGFDD